MTVCGECGARYEDDRESCDSRFAQLLALDHSRREPWGSRHGQAFAAFALQHPERHGASLDSAWQSLYRVYVLRETPPHVFGSLRAAGGRLAAYVGVPARPPIPRRKPDVTIADLRDFDAASYPALLDAWCVAALRAWEPALRG